MTNDLVGVAIDRAVMWFGDQGDGLFNAAGFEAELHALADVDGRTDERVVHGILASRPDVERLPGGNPYRRLSSPLPSCCGYST